MNPLQLKLPLLGNPGVWGASVYAEPKSATWQSHLDYGVTGHNNLSLLPTKVASTSQPVTTQHQPGPSPTLIIILSSNTTLNQSFPPLLHTLTWTQTQISITSTTKLMMRSIGFSPCLPTFLNLVLLSCS